MPSPMPSLVQARKKKEQPAAQPEGHQPSDSPDAQRIAAPQHRGAAILIIRQGLLGPDVVVVGEQVVRVVLTLDRGEPLMGLGWIDRGDILVGD